MKLKLDLERVVSIVAFIFLSLAFSAAIVLNGDPLSILPYSRAILIVVHGVCAIATFITIFRPSSIMQIIILLTESFITTITNYEMLGVMFFYCALVIILIKNLLKERVKFRITTIFILHIINILLMYTHGWTRTLITLATSAFFFTFYMWIYSVLKSRLSCVIPSAVTNNKSLKNHQPGSTLHLTEFNLTERQITFVLDFMNQNLSYKALSDKYNVSLSTVKKEFTEIFKIFEVTKIEELQILLIQYVIEK